VTNLPLPFFLHRGGSLPTCARRPAGQHAPAACSQPDRAGQRHADDSEFQTRSTGRSGKGCANWQFTAESSGEPRTYGPRPRRRGVWSGRGGRFWLAQPPATIWRFGCRQRHAASLTASATVQMRKKAQGQNCHFKSKIHVFLLQI
jgi:hypothetical protein